MAFTNLGLLVMSVLNIIYALELLDDNNGKQDAVNSRQPRQYLGPYNYGRNNLQYGFPPLLPFLQYGPPGAPPSTNNAFYPDQRIAYPGFAYGLQPYPGSNYLPPQLQPVPPTVRKPERVDPNLIYKQTPNFHPAYPFVPQVASGVTPSVFLGGYPKPAYIPQIEKDAEQIPLDPNGLPISNTGVDNKPKKFELEHEYEREPGIRPNLIPEIQNGNLGPGHRYFILNGQELYSSLPQQNQPSKIYQNNNRNQNAHQQPFIPNRPLQTLFLNQPYQGLPIYGSGQSLYSGLDPLTTLASTHLHDKALFGVPSTAVLAGPIIGGDDFLSHNNDAEIAPDLEQGYGALKLAQFGSQMQLGGVNRDDQNPGISNGDGDTIVIDAGSKNENASDAPQEISTESAKEPMSSNSSNIYENQEVQSNENEYSDKKNN